jgi:hypothetical protein
MPPQSDIFQHAGKTLDPVHSKDNIINVCKVLNIERVIAAKDARFTTAVPHTRPTHTPQSEKHNELFPLSKMGAREADFQPEGFLFGCNPGGVTCSWFMRVAPDSTWTTKW